MECHCGSAQAKIQCLINSITAQSTSIKLATMVGVTLTLKTFIRLNHLVDILGRDGALLF